MESSSEPKPTQSIDPHKPGMQKAHKGSSPRANAQKNPQRNPQTRNAKLDPLPNTQIKHVAETAKVHLPSDELRHLYHLTGSDYDVKKVNDIVLHMLEHLFLERPGSFFLSFLPIFLYSFSIILYFFPPVSLKHFFFSMAMEKKKMISPIISNMFPFIFVWLLLLKETTK